jgi:hypothetical protein
MYSSLLDGAATSHRANVEVSGRIVAGLTRRVSTFVVLEARLSGVSAAQLRP